MGNIAIPDGWEIVDTNKPKQTQGIQIPNGWELVTDAAQPAGLNAPAQTPRLPAPAPIIPDVTPRLKPPAPNIEVQANQKLEARKTDKPFDRKKARSIAHNLFSAGIMSNQGLRSLAELFGSESDIGRLDDKQQLEFVSNQVEKARKDIQDAKADMEALSKPDEELLKTRRFKSSNSAVGFSGADRLRLARKDAEKRFKNAQKRLQDADGIISGTIPPPEFGPIKNMAAGSIKAFLNAFGEDLPKSAGAIQASLTGKDPEDTTLFQIGQGFADVTDATLHTDRARQNMTGQQVAEGLGQAGSMLTPAASAKALSLPASVGRAGTFAFGAAQSGSAGLDEAIAFKADTNQKLTSFYLNAGLGLTEALPINRFLGRLEKSTGGRVSNIIKNSTATGLEEMLQEVTQQIGQNIIASEIAKFDEGRDPFQGVGDAAKVGGIVGAILGGAGGAIRRPTPGTESGLDGATDSSVPPPGPTPAGISQSLAFESGQNVPNSARDASKLALLQNPTPEAVQENDSQQALQDSTGDIAKNVQIPPGFEIMPDQNATQGNATRLPQTSPLNTTLFPAQVFEAARQIPSNPVTKALDGQSVLTQQSPIVDLPALTQTQAQIEGVQIPEGFEVLSTPSNPQTQLSLNTRQQNAGTNPVSLSKSGDIRRVPEIPAGFEVIGPQNTATNKTPQTQGIPPLPEGFEILAQSGGELAGQRQRPHQGIATPQGQTVGRNSEVSRGLHDVTTRLHKSLGLTARQGRVPLKGALGTFNTGTGVIRTRKGWRSEIDVFSHEGGHALEVQMGKGFRDILEANQGELIPMDYVKGRKDKRLAVSEGFAEFFRTYVTNPAYAKNHAPAFFKAFETDLAQTRPELLSDLRTVQSEYQTFLDAPSAESVSGDIVSEAKKSKIKSIGQDIKERGTGGYISNLSSRVYTALVDKHHPFVRTVNSLKILYSRNLSKHIDLKAARDPAKLLRLALDSTSSGHMDLMHGVRPYGSTEAQGPGLSDAIETAMGGAGKGWTDKQLQDFGAYLVSRRAVHEWARYRAGEIPNPPTKHGLGDHLQAIEDFQRANPTWSKAADMVYEWTSNMWRKKRDAGLISQESYEAGLKIKDYVPFRRDMTDADLKDVFSGVSPSQTGKASITKRFRGSDKAIINPIESLMLDAYQTAQTIARNDVLIALDSLARSAGPGAGAIVERLPQTELKATTVDAAEAIEKAAIQNGLNPVDAKNLKNQITDLFDGDTTATLFRAGTLNERGEPIVYMWQNGERIPLRIGDKKNAMNIYGIFTGLNEEQKNLFIDAAALPTTALRYGVTTSPDFIFANYIRDQLSAWILTDIGFKPFISGAKGIAQELSQTDVSRLYNSFGGIMGGQNVAALDNGRINKDILALKKKGVRIRRFASWKGFAQLSEVSETGTRLAIFTKQMKEAKARGLSDHDAAIEAAFESRDYIDFGRHGSRMLIARRLATFMNAGIQGLDKSIRVSTANGQLLRRMHPYLVQRLTGKSDLTPQEARAVARGAKLWAKVTAIGLFGLALNKLYEDDPEYDEFSEYLRATHWMVKLPTGKNGENQWYAITKPFELAFMSNIFERSYERFAHDDEKAGERLRKGLGKIFIPPHSVPGVVLPFELWANKKTFNQAPIVPPHMKALEPSLQHTAYVSDFGIKVGRVLNLSPAQIDHVVQSLTGSWGRNLLEVGNTFNDERPARDQSTTPILRRFAKNPHFGAQSKTEMFKLANRHDGKWTMVGRTVDKYLDKGDPKKALEFLAKQKDEAAREWGIINAMGKAKDKRLHPLRRALDAQDAAGDMRKEMVLGPLELTSDNGRRLHLTPLAKREVSTLLAELQTTYARNALIMMDHPGWKGKPTMDEAALMRELTRLRPDVARELETRQAKLKVAPNENLQSNYDKFKSMVPGLTRQIEGEAKEQERRMVAVAN